MAVEEFFELFKTPWEFYVPNRRYDLLISTVEEMPTDLNAGAVIIYQSCATRYDDELGIAVVSQTKPGWVDWNGMEFPVYGNLATLQAFAPPVLHHRETRQAVGCFVNSELPAVRIGFDVFEEVAFLLTEGQPSENAGVPTLDLHISLLQATMVGLGIAFVEVPPVPAGYDFMVCLTHDVDFVGIRDHKWDHTMWGFLYRSVVGSLARALRGQLPWSRCLRNWAAACSLPLVHLGLREDFWLEFDRYQEIEKDFGSTFFFIPFKDMAGTAGGAAAPRRRAAKYDFGDIQKDVVALLKNGREIGLHGIDAWHSPVNGRAELQRIQESTGQTEIGTRMHWLYWNHASPCILEEAGFSYDSTFGYNDALGFRAGTTQPFRPLGVERLLELPLNIQDSAMFYSGRMKLTEAEALVVCKAVIKSISSLGGALTLNWHTRSLSPERLWGDFYMRLLSEIRTHRVWFGTGEEVVGWFRRRRALQFQVQRGGKGEGIVALISPDGYSDPSFTVRTYQAACSSDKSVPGFRMPAYTDYLWEGEEVLMFDKSDGPRFRLSDRTRGHRQDVEWLSLRDGISEIPREERLLQGRHSRRHTFT